MPPQDPDKSQPSSLAQGRVSSGDTTLGEGVTPAAHVRLPGALPSGPASERASALVPESVASGLRLPARYRDLGVIATGGFGEVRRVFDRHLERVVAMKLLLPDIADSEQVQIRFLTEAKLTAGLEHPGIVPVYDWGQLLDGRLWFTMREVRGQTLRHLIDELHASRGPDDFRETPSGWTFRRLVDAFARICQAVAFAHRRGVVHRDLKPDNVMVGELGEVMVMDWGLGLRVGAVGLTNGGGELVSDHEGPPSGRGDETPTSERSASITQYGQVLGTPSYMSPEQARGDRHLHGLPSDVYALGAILYHLLAGRKPYEGSKYEVLRQVRRGPPPPLAGVLVGRTVPSELVAICEQAMQRAIDDRYPDAEAMAREVLAWLDGVRRREQALAVLARAGSAQDEVRALRRAAQSAQAEAREILAATRPFDPVTRKLPGWQREDEAAEAAREATLREAAWLERVHGALSLDPGLPEAHALLADHYRERLREAEIAHRDEDAARFELALRAHDRGRHAAFLRGDSSLSLVTDPPGALVWLEPYTPRDRRLEPGPARLLGTTPLRDVALGRGSYRLRVQAPGCREVLYPVHLERDSLWDGRRPGEREPHPITLPALDALGPDEVYVPAGWCWVGGDPLAMDGLERRRVWVDGFVIDRFPVTNAAYVAFLNDLLDAGREAEALAACPRLGRTVSETHGSPVYGRDAAGRFSLTDGNPGQLWHPDWPVVLVDWHGARAYARWRSDRTGLGYRMPDELEREKAARGADGRLFPWGDHFDATWACIIDSHEGEPTRVAVTSFGLDESPYGVRGLAGNVRDWCDNIWTREGPPVDDGRLVPQPADPSDPELRTVRGGAWKSLPDLSRAAARFASRPDQRWTTTGLRLVRPLDPQGTACGSTVAQ